MAGSSPPRAVGTFSSLSPIDVQQAQKDKLFNKRLKDVERETLLHRKRFRRHKRELDILRGSSTPVTWQRKVKASDESVTNSTTLQNDDELTTNVVSGTSYTFIAKLFISNAGATAGVKVAMNGTGTVSALKSQVRIFDDVTNTIAELSRATSLGGSVGVGLSTGNAFAMLEGSFTCNGSGTFVVQWAQNTADAGNATTVQSMSSLEVFAT